MKKMEAALRLMDLPNADDEDVQAAARYVFDNEEDGADMKIRAAQVLARFSAELGEEVADAVKYVFDNADE